MSAAGQRWPRCSICGETRNHRHSCNDDWHGTEPVLVLMSAEDYFENSGGSSFRSVVEALAVKHGGRWVGSGTDMTTGVSDVQYDVPKANVAAFVAEISAARAVR